MISQDRYETFRNNINTLIHEYRDRFFYLIIFIDEYSRYIVHHALLTAMDADSVSLEAQTAIDKIRKDSVADPCKQRITDHHSSPWNSGSR